MGLYQSDWFLATNMEYVLNIKGPAQFLYSNFFSLYRDLNWRASDPEADDIPMCHRASLVVFKSKQSLLLIRVNILIQY